MKYEEDENSVRIKLGAEDEFTCNNCGVTNGAYSFGVKFGKPVAMFSCVRCSTEYMRVYDIIVIKEIKQIFWR